MSWKRYLNKSFPVNKKFDKLTVHADKEDPEDSWMFVQDEFVLFIH